MTWYRPASLEELLELKGKHPQAKLVIGNTEVGKLTMVEGSARSPCRIK